MVEDEPRRGIEETLLLLPPLVKKQRSKTLLLIPPLVLHAAPLAALEVEHATAAASRAHAAARRSMLNRSRGGSREARVRGKKK